MLQKNFLKEVIARIDFAQPVGTLNQVVLPDKVQQVLKSRYPIFEPSKALSQDVMITDAGVTTNSQEIHQWTYHGGSREKTITITQHFITVSLKEYRDYDEFKLDVIQPIEELSKIEGEIFINRTGLRYVNIFPNISNGYSELSQNFQPMISSSFQSLIDSDNLSRNILVSEYLHDEVKLRVQSGLFNPDYPAKLKNKEFALDFDAFIDTPHSFKDINNIFDSLHKIIQDKFELHITDSLREHLNGE